MKAGDQTSRTIRGVTEEQYQQIVREEFAAMLYEEYGDEALDEGLWDKLKGRGKRVGAAFSKLYSSFAEVVEAAFGLDIEEDPSAAEKVDAPEPEEVAQELEAGDTEAVADSIEDMEPVLQKVIAKGGPEAKQAQQVMQQVDKLSTAVEKEGGDEEGDDDGTGPDGTKKTEDSPALLDMIDKIIDEWDAIQGKTKDKSLKKAMDYIEKVALAELLRQRGLQRLKEIREKRKNG